MIQLRWIVHRVRHEVGTGGMMYDTHELSRRLQFRTLRDLPWHAVNDEDNWTDWTDVPEVNAIAA